MKIQEPPKAIITPWRHCIGTFWKLHHMSCSRIRGLIDAVGDFQSIRPAQKEKIVSRGFAIVGAEKLNAKKTKATDEVGLGNQTPTMDKFVHLIGIILLL
jgi:hypothetical protein